MKNFSFSNPVKIIFGKNTISKIANEIPKGSKVLITYGGGSIKRNGIYEQVTKALSEYEWYEFSGIEPNPHYETCMEAVSLIKEKGVTFILAVGGGSVIDASKFIAAASCFQGEDPWQILSQRINVKEALPLGTVLTISATGTEMNANAVITKASTKDKLGMYSEAVFPKFSILDPEVTYTLPLKQIGNGVVDSFVHIVEQYLTASDEDTLMQDLWAESLLKTLVIEGPKALTDPENYDVRANLMWTSSWAVNGWIGCGVDQDWATHRIGHELTAFFGLDHAATLAIILPGVMTVLKDEKAKKIIQLGRNVFGIDLPTDSEVIDETIKFTERFFERMGISTHLSSYKLDQEAIDIVQERLNERGWKLSECQNITGDVAASILDLRR